MPAPAPGSGFTRALPPRAVWKYVGGLAPVVLLWAALVGWLAAVMYDRANWSREADAADVREWLDEARNFRKALPELIKEYAAILGEDPPGPDALNRRANKRGEIDEHMRSLAEPTLMYANQLPLFPEIYSLEVLLPGFQERDGTTIPPIAWESQMPKPRLQNQTLLRLLEYGPLGPGDSRAAIRCEYRLHAFNTLQRDEQEARKNGIRVVAVLVTATVMAMLFVVRFLRRERARELTQLRTEAESEHQRRELAEAQVRQQWAERVQEDLGRKLLEQELEAAKMAKKADEADRSALELKSQLYAGIGIMAGSYAHNIKNLLVRPNDLLTRCIETDAMSPDQQGMLGEVKATLGTVTERLQQILRTVRRDPSKVDVTRLDLNELVRAMQRDWAEMGWDKWKLRVTARTCPGPLWIDGDLSHLQQAVENLLFNARDATFEMRNDQRERARREPADDSAARRQKLLEAAAWKGEIHLATHSDDGFAVLEVRDNGIGMTREVRDNCLKTHYTTKRNNALFEGLSAGMGLGLSFVAVVLEHHGATLEVESEPFAGALFRVRMPLAEQFVSPTREQARAS